MVYFGGATKMRLFGLVPKLFVCSVAAHTGVLAGVAMQSSMQRDLAQPRSQVVHLSILGGSSRAGSATRARVSQHLKRLSMEQKNLVPLRKQRANELTRSPLPPTEVKTASLTGAAQGGSSDGQTIIDAARGPKLIAGSVERPPYTDDARAARFEGTLEVEVTTTADGRVTEARLLNPSGLDLDDGVIAAARLAIYDPPLDSDGRQLAGRARLKFRFYLEERL